MRAVCRMIAHYLLRGRSRDRMSEAPGLVASLPSSPSGLSPPLVVLNGADDGAAGGVDVLDLGQRVRVHLHRVDGLAVLRVGDAAVRSYQVVESMGDQESSLITLEETRVALPAGFGENRDGELVLAECASTLRPGRIFTENSSVALAPRQPPRPILTAVVGLLVGEAKAFVGRAEPARGRSRCHRRALAGQAVDGQACATALEPLSQSEKDPLPEYSSFHTRLGSM